MAESRWADALSVFQDAIGSAVGRGLSFFATCWLSMAATFALHDLSGFAGAIGEAAFSLLYMVPIGWLGMVAAGMVQIWGIPSYLMLAGLFVKHMQEDSSVILLLTVTAIVQSFETWRCAMHAGGWSWTLASGVFIAGWTVFAGGFAVQVWREKSARGNQA